MQKEKLVLIGNGMAGVRALEELLKLAPDTYEITVFGAEPHPNYNRIMLSPVLAGEKNIDDIVLNVTEFSIELDHGQIAATNLEIDLGASEGQQTALGFLLA